MLLGFEVMAQVDSSSNNLMNELDNKATAPQGKKPVKVFYGQKLINANTVEMLQKGFLEFKVIHNFGDIAGSQGGIHRFFGLDNAMDVKIGFQLGLTKNFNIVGARTRGDNFHNVTELWELGLKYRFLQQMEKDRSNPISLSAYVNTVVSASKPTPNPDKESNYQEFSDRLSSLVQVMVARKFGKISLQLNPTYVYTNMVSPGADRNIFAIGGGIRLPVTKAIVIIADYFHTFRSQESRDSTRAIAARHPAFPLSTPPKPVYNQYGDQYDVFGIGFEIITAGHIFHLNFTNATNILENRFLPHTLTSWGKGQWRWGFTVARNFVVFRDKKKK
jgi:hypothetical protein